MHFKGINDVKSCNMYVKPKNQILHNLHIQTVLMFKAV
ncbi:hypothetical protein V462_11280 [Pantoea ananatis 15320]|nr:hypothetical protein V462_11280 [Pantoea ananatis 15320]